MSNRLPHEMEWAAEVRNELLDYRLKFDHEPASERGEHYRGVIQRAVKSLRDGDPRADPGHYLRELERLFPPWQVEVPLSHSGPSPATQPSPRELTAEELVDLLLEKAPTLEVSRKTALAKRLDKVFLPKDSSGSRAAEVAKAQAPAPASVTAPSPRAAGPVRVEGSPALQCVRERFGVAADAEIDPEMVFTSFLAVADLLHDILGNARTTWAAVNPIAEDFLNGDEIFRRLGPYLSTEWKENMKRQKEKLNLMAAVTVNFSEVRRDMEAVVNEGKADLATLVAVLRGMVELQLPNPSMVIAMLKGAIERGPHLFAEEHIHLFDWKRIEDAVTAVFRSPWPIPREADGREFWDKYKEILGDHYTPASLTTQVAEALVSGTQRDPYCPPALRKE